jgi:hypothetical protein
MKAHELFGVGVRWIGLICVLSGLPAISSFNYTAILGVAGQIVVGLILITRADLIVRLCYPKEFRES